MRAVVLLMFGLACAADAHKLNTRVEQMHRHPKSAAESFATLLLALQPAAAFNPSSAGARPMTLNRQGRLGQRAPVMGANPTAKFKTSMGEFEAEIYLDQMPYTASNFIDLAKTGWYNGLFFHRVIPGFMAQFGCANTRGTKDIHGAGVCEPMSTFTNLVTGETKMRSPFGNIDDELTAKISNEPGTLSMANSGSPNTGGSQFFINTKHNKQLDWFDDATPSKHPVFGKVTTGMDVVVKITEVDRDPQDKPRTPVTMESVEIIQ